jgi:hypothetical protein
MCALYLMRKFNNVRSSSCVVKLPSLNSQSIITGACAMVLLILDDNKAHVQCLYQTSLIDIM